MNDVVRHRTETVANIEDASRIHDILEDISKIELKKDENGRFLGERYTIALII